jgi:hypothetical protein
MNDDDKKAKAEELLRRLEKLKFENGERMCSTRPQSENQKVNLLRVVKDFEVHFFEVFGVRLLLQTWDPGYQELADIVYCLNNPVEMLDMGYPREQVLLDLAAFYCRNLGDFEASWLDPVLCMLNQDLE